MAFLQYFCKKIQSMVHNDTIVALATPSGSGAIAIIRLSGRDAIPIASKLFQSVSGKTLDKQPTHTVHLGHIVRWTSSFG